MMGVNVAAIVAIPVVLLLLLLVIGLVMVGVVVYYKCCQVNKGLSAYGSRFVYVCVCVCNPDFSKDAKTSTEA